MPRRLSDADLAQAPQGPTPLELAARGTVRPVLIYPDPHLRQICVPVGRLDWESLTALAADLLATMYDAGGRGLAAPQIGQNYRIFVMDHSWKTGTPAPRIVLDPQIVAIGSTLDEMEEGCLSIPDRPVRVTRPDMIQMSCFDLSGLTQILRLDGIEARIAQHEADHLDGRLIIDMLHDT